MRLGLAAAMLMVLAAVVSAPAHAMYSVVFTPSNVEQLHAGEGLYEMWAVIGGSPYPIGRFNADPDGTHLKTPEGQRLDSLMTTLDMAAASAIMITAEPEGDTDDTPAYHLLAAPFSLSTSPEGVAVNSTDLNGMGVDFTGSNCSGTFVLATPSTTDHTRYDSGIWFAAKSGANYVRSLTLPTLPGGLFGWQYQGWIQDESSADPIPYSTGEFYTPAAADRDGAGCGAGPNAPSAPGFPGQDFLNYCPDDPTAPVLPDLNNGHWATVITVEPSPNTGPNPFGFKPLQLLSIPSGLLENVSAVINNSSGNLPSGTVTVRDLGGTPVAPASWGAIKDRYRR